MNIEYFAYFPLAMLLYSVSTGIVHLRMIVTRWPKSSFAFCAMIVGYCDHSDTTEHCHRYPDTLL
jgi:hypothetical protein